MKRKTVSLVLLTVLILGLGACNGGGGGGTPPPPVAPTYTISVFIPYLTGSGLVLQNNGGNDLGISAKGTYAFSTTLPDGGNYAITVAHQPSNPNQTCQVVNGTGTVAGNNVIVTVNCLTNAYTIGGTVSGLSGTGLVLINNGGNDKSIATNGSFSFSNGVADGEGYTVTVKTHPSAPFQTCTVTNGTGTLSGAAVTNVMVSCANNLIAFVTSTSGNANIGLWSGASPYSGVTAADAVCQGRAKAAGLPSGTYKAWLSDDNNDAYCRVQNLSGKKSAKCGQATLPANAGPWLRTDGVVFAEKLDQLTSATGRGVITPLNRNESGQYVDGIAFTGTQRDGTLQNYGSYTSCTNWTVASTDWTAGGYTTSATGAWTLESAHCDNPYGHLYCLQTGAGAVLPPYTSTGKKAFVTSVTGNGNLASWNDAGGKSGVAAGDAICAARAKVAGLTGGFKAWLSNSTVNARDRFNSNGPWVRLDGVMIAADKTELTSGTLRTALNQTEWGAYIGSHAGVFTGTTEAGGKTTSHCGDWTVATTASYGTSGHIASASSKWTNATLTQCAFAYATLYCLED